MFTRKFHPSLALSEFVLLAVLSGAHCLAAPATTQQAAAAPEIATSSLTLAPTILDPRETAIGALAGINLFITGTDLFDQKPEGIKKDATYVGKPRYGAFRLGNGPKSVTLFAVDQAKDFAGKIYIDVNQNGDLTDDGPGDWDRMQIKYGSRNFEKTIALHASWGTALEEKESGTYTLWIVKGESTPGVAFCRTSGRVGTITLRGKTYPVAVGENTGDGIFTIPADADMTRSPVTLYIDTANSSPFDPMATPSSRRMPEKFNIGHPFQVDGHWFFARTSVSGATLKAQETDAPDAPKAAAPAVAPDKLPIGTAAPDFTVQTPDGKPLRLSDFKGKVVILDLWATWCGPCQASMPDLEKLYQRVKDQDVVVLSVNVLDEKEPFDAWIAKHSNTDYHFNFAFDAAGKENTSITKSTYEVPAIPAWFLISREGKIAAKDLGYSGNQDKLMKALRDQGVRVDPTK